LRISSAIIIIFLEEYSLKLLSIFAVQIKINVAYMSTEPVKLTSFVPIPQEDEQAKSLS